jgi:hypothetical protein
MARIKVLPVLLGLPFLTSAAQTPSNTGRWIVSTDYLGTPLTPVLNLEQTGEKVMATGRGYKYVGTIHGTALHLTATDEQAIPMKSSLNSPTARWKEPTQKRAPMIRRTR